ncbi:MAG: hypothetical protein ACRCYU_03330, partial [Nocardioides sp.]
SAYERRVRLEDRIPIPRALGGVVGDAVHNLRSALESVAYAIAREDCAESWTEKHEKRTTFAVRQTSAEFDKWLIERKFYSKRARDALRVVQPFYWVERTGFDLNPPYRMRFASLMGLQHAWNIDKHRYPLRARWTAGDCWWGTSGEERTRRRITPPHPGDSPDVIAYQYDPPGGSTDHGMYWDLRVTIDDPALPAMQVADQVRYWRHEVHHAVWAILSEWAADTQGVVNPGGLFVPNPD